MWKSRFILPLCLSVLAAQPALAAQTPSAGDLESEIMKSGAHATVERLWHHDLWDGVMDRVGEGRADYIALVPLLASGTDAGASEDLGISLAFALPKNPAAVLAVIGGKQGGPNGPIVVERVCGIPFIEDTMPKHYLRDAVKAVESITDPVLQQQKQDCMKDLKQSGRDAH